MKKIFFILLVMTACGGKNNDPEPVIKTDPIIQPGYDSFLYYANYYNVIITNKAVLKFGPCDCQKNNTWYVNTTKDDDNMGFYIFHALGHALLNKSESSEISVMNMNSVSYWGTKKDVMIQDLFTK